MSPPNVYLTFSGVSFSGGGTTVISVLCGDNPPTLTNGWAKWATIDRPLARGVTVLQGYDPDELTCELRFGTWAIDGTFTWDMNDSIEWQISALESWMGTKMTGGLPSVVYVQALDPAGKQTTLIPQRYWDMPWIITNVQYGESYRNPKGHRIRQDATVTLTNYINFGATPGVKEGKAGGYFKTTPLRRTALTIAGASSGGTPPTLVDALAGNILRSTKNNPIRGTHILLAHKGKNWKIPLNVNVWIPGHQT